MKIHKRLFALLLVFALVIGLLPSVLADNEPDISAAESAEETLVDSQSEESPAIAPPTQSILESDEAVEDSEVEAENEVSTSMDGETLTRMDNDGLMLLGGGGTMGKSTCVTFVAYQSARWKCHRYEVDGSHSYGHYFYTSEIAYHTIDGVDSYCIEPNTTSLGGQYYTSYTAEEASSSSYWKLELDDLQRSHIQKILAFGYPQVDYGYSRQVQYAATQVLIWEVVSHSRYNADIKSCTDYGLYRNVYAVLGADFQSCYDGILNAISVSDGMVPSFAGTSQSSAKSITLTLNNSTGCYEGSVRDISGVLSHFTFSTSGVNFSRSGSTLYISVPASGADAVKGQTITGTSNQKLMSTSNPTIWENPTYQTVLTAGGADYLHAYISLTWADAPKTGSLVVSKAVNYGSWSGFTFRLYGTSDKGNAVDVTAATGSDGKAYFKDMEIGTYTLEEVSPGNAYILPEPQTVTIPGDEIAYTNMENVWKHWRATITKVDADTGKAAPQGDAMAAVLRIRSCKQVPIQKTAAQKAIRQLGGQSATDAMEMQVLDLLNSLCGRPEQLHVQPIRVEGHSCAELRTRLENIMAVQPVDEEAACDLILKLAAAQYDMIGATEYETVRLKGIFAEAKPMESLDVGLLRNTVAEINTNENGAVSLKLKNHQIVSR